MNFKKRLINLLHQVEGSAVIPEGASFLPETKAWFNFKINFVLSDPDFLTEEIVSGYESLWAKLRAEKTEQIKILPTEMFSVRVKESLEKTKEILPNVALAEFFAQKTLLHVLNLEDVEAHEIEEALMLFEDTSVQHFLREKLLGEHGRLYQILYGKQHFVLPLNDSDTRTPIKLSGVRFVNLLSKRVSLQFTKEELNHLIDLTDSVQLMIARNEILSMID